MNILILGGTGYIGSHIALDLARGGHRVTVAARPPARGSSSAARMVELDAAGVAFVHADLSHPGELVAAADPSEVEVIVHGVCSFLEPAEDPQNPGSGSLTLRAMEEMLALAARCPRLVQAIDLSNNLVMEPQKPDDFPDEDYPCHPRTAHGRNKLKAERMLQESGLPWVILRLPQVYGGVGSSFDWIMVDPIRRKDFPVPCDGTNRISCVHVEDGVQAVRLVIEKGVRNRIYNVASGEQNLTLGQVFDEVARGFHLPPPMRLPRSVALAAMGTAERWARWRGQEPTLVADMVWTLANNRTLDIARARAELGYEPRYPDTLAGIRSSYAEIFAGRADPFTPPGRMAAAQGLAGPPQASEDAAAFWHRWTPWRHGDPGEGSFADVMAVLRLPEAFAAFCARHLPAGATSVTVVDLACGAASMAGPMDRALQARGATMRRYIGIDRADPEWMPPRVARELERHGLQERGEYVFHDLSLGLPEGLAARIPPEDTLLLISCWGISYLDPIPMGALLRQCADLARSRAGQTPFCVNVMSPNRQDKAVLTRRFIGEVVPNHLMAAVRQRDMAPVRAIRLALRALPMMRRFGDELKAVALLIPLQDFEAVVRSVDLEMAERDATALWGATCNYAIRLPEGQAP